MLALSPRLDPLFACGDPGGDAFRCTGTDAGGILGCPENPQPHALVRPRPGGRMDPRGSEFPCKYGNISAQGGSGACSCPPSSPWVPPCPSPSTPRLLSHLPEPPPRGITPGKMGKMREKRKIWAPHPGRLRLGELVGSERMGGEGTGLALLQKRVFQTPLAVKPIPNSSSVCGAAPLPTPGSRSWAA